MTFWIEVGLMIALYVALWAWLTWRLLERFERELWSARGAHEPPDRAGSASGRLEAEIPVSGMVCGVCERRVSAALARLEGVREAEADRLAERVRVRYDPERVGEERLREQIEQAGYEVAS